MLRFMLVVLTTLLTCLSSAQTIPLNFTNRPLTGPEMNNPGRGAEYWNGEFWDDINGVTVPQGTATGYNGYVRFNWYEMEKTQGQ